MMKCVAGTIWSAVLVLLAAVGASCAMSGSNTGELFTPTPQRALTEDRSAPVAGYYAGALPWEEEAAGLVPVHMAAAAVLVPGDGKMTASLDRVPFVVPAESAGGRRVAALSAGEDYYHAVNVAPSVVQGMTFEPAAGGAFACFELAQDDAWPYTVGLAWHSLPSELDSYFVGIGDEQRGRWHWFYGPDDGVLTFDPAQWGDGGPTGDELLVCVVLEDGLPADFWQLKSGVSEVRGTGLVYEDPAQYVGQLDAVETARQTSALPARVSLRSYLPPVSDQGAMGSCSAFAIADAAWSIMLAQFYSQYGWDERADANRASPMWCYVMTGFPPFGHWHPPCGTDSPRLLGEAFNLLRDAGCATAETVPYYATSHCQKTFPDEADSEAALLQINGWTALPRYGLVAAIKEQLGVFNRPVPIAMKRLESKFLSYSGGVYHYGGTSGQGPSHAMCIVGYDDELEAFDVRNSWGASWGVGGYWWCGYDAVTDLAALNRFSGYYMVATPNPAAAEYFLGREVPPDYDEVEPNDSLARANSLPDLSFMGYAAGFTADDPCDFFAFRYATDDHTTIFLDYNDAQIRPRASLHDSSGALLARAEERGGQLILSGTWSASGTAVVLVDNYGGATGDYTISGIVKSVPAAPRGLRATDGTSTDGVRVFWNPAPEAESYLIQRGAAADGAFVDLGTTFDQSFLDDAAGLWQMYWYRVQAVNDNGSSQPSPADGGYVGIPAPAGVTASDGEYSDRIRVTWVDVDQQDYVVLRGLTPAGPFATVGRYSAPPVEDTAVVPGVVYHYVVCCAHAGLKGPLSEPDRGYAPLPAADGSVTTGDGGSQIPLVEGGGLTESGDGKIQVLP